MGRLPDGPRSCCVRYGSQGYACNTIWPEQFAPLRLVRNLSQLSFSGSHLGTKHSLLGLDRSLGLGGERGRRPVVDIVGRTASAGFAATA